MGGGHKGGLGGGAFVPPACMLKKALLPCKIVYLVQDLSENHFVRKLPEIKY